MSFWIQGVGFYMGRVAKKTMVPLWVRIAMQPQQRDGSLNSSIPASEKAPLFSARNGK